MEHERWAGDFSEKLNRLGDSQSINCPRLFAIKNVEPTVGCRRSYFRTKWSEMTVCAMSMEASSVAQSF